MKYQLNRLFALALAALLAGCSTTGDTPTGEEAAVEDRGSGAEGVAASGAAGAGAFAGAALDDPNSPLARRVIYFEYDSSEIMAEDQDMVAAHAAYLASNPNQTITLEGHGDERGSREYNIGLGDRRAQSVRRVFELQGVSPQQINIVSYGEEKPAAEGHSEAAWRLNRRVEIVYAGY
ncbi:MAG: peptidoglycan-associated lipoprotein Pal [Gammaproteobacteria bacterium]|nr:MAG: peptidoglycan-associated lipoprotein Pal [Gammaproteobacteria bacterium]